MLCSPVLAVTLVATAFGQQACPPAGTDLASLRELKQREFALADSVSRARLATDLLACLGSPDPELRDDIAFTAYSTWLRGKQLDTAKVRTLREDLYQLLDGEDTQGFRRPFAALVLSEVARTDRIEPWMSTAERAAMVDRATAYLASVRDYRGFDPRDGWRHGVAHGSDWLMQLALNPALSRPQLDSMLAAIATQAVPESGHAYVFGEPERLARPVLYIASRGALTAADWNAWFASLIARLGPEENASKDPVWLARRHDLYAFLSELYLNTGLTVDPNIRALQAPVAEALKRLS
jgi:hypothetical protein